MIVTRKRTWAALAAAGLLAAVPAAATAQNAPAAEAPAATSPRSAEEILKDYDAVKVPTFDASKQQDQAYILDYARTHREATEAKAKLAQELYQAHPENARVPEVLPEYWTSLVMGGDIEAARKQIATVLAETKSEKLRVEAAFWKLRLALSTNRDFDAAQQAADEFLKIAPKDERGPQVLYMVASLTDDPEKKAAIEDRILKDYPDSMFGSMIAGERRRREQIGKPFELEFTDAVSGSTISMKDLKGKVVVIDFWATWCGPCVAELPHMKELYAQYKDQGVEFIGVSLDQPESEGGLMSLKEFVKKNDIPWPQYYQGDGWNSKFSSGWGINSIPALFVVDASGQPPLGRGPRQARNAAPRAHQAARRVRRQARRRRRVTPPAARPPFNFPTPPAPGSLRRGRGRFVRSPRRANPARPEEQGRSLASVPEITPTRPGPRQTELTRVTARQASRADVLDGDSCMRNGPTIALRNLQSTRPGGSEPRKSPVN